MANILDSDNASYSIVAIAGNSQIVAIKTGLALNDVNNTAPADKPVSAALTASLLTKVAIISNSAAAGVSEFISAVPTVDFAFAEDQIYKGNPAVAGGVLVKGRGRVDGEYSRASAATQTDIQGNTQYAPENLLSYSETLTDPSWVKASITATSTSNIAPPYSAATSVYTLAHVSATGYSNIKKTVTGLVDTDMWYTLSVYAKNVNGQLSLEIGDTTGTAADAVFDLYLNTASSVSTGTITGVERAANGWHRYSISKRYSAPASTLNVVATIGLGTGATGRSILVAAPQFERYATPRAYIATTSAAAYGPRWIYDQTQTAVDYENLSAYSQQFDRGNWTGAGNTNITIVSTQTRAQTSDSPSTGITSPNGEPNAYQIAASATAGIHKLYKGSDLGAYVGNVTISIFAKLATASSIQYITLQDSSANTAKSVFNLTNGTVNTEHISYMTGFAAIQSAGNGWYRCSHTFASDGIPAVSIGIGSQYPDESYTGTGAAADSIYIWGFQVERGAYTRKYTHTTTAPLYGVGRSPCLGLLSEFSSTNLLYDSQKLGSGLGIGWNNPAGVSGHGSTPYPLYDCADYKAIANTDVFTTYTANNYTTPLSHGFANGQPVKIASVNQASTGIVGHTDTAYTTYYATAVTPSTFKLSTTSGGTPIVNVAFDATGIVLLNTTAKFSVNAGSKTVTMVSRGGAFAANSVASSQYALGGHYKIELETGPGIFSTQSFIYSTAIQQAAGVNTYTFGVDVASNANYANVSARQYQATFAPRAAATDGNIANQTGTRNPMGVVSNTIFQSSDSTYGYPFELFQAGIPVTSSTPVIYTISVFIKKINYSFFTLTINGGGTHSVFNFEDGKHTLTTSPGQYSNARAEKFNDGWYRISITKSFTTGVDQTTLSQNGLWMCRQSDGQQGFGFLWDAKVHVWGMQLEKNSSASSYIPTASSATSGTTRASNDVLTISGNNFLNAYKANEGTLFAEYKSIWTGFHLNTIVSLGSQSAGYTGNRIYIGTVGQQPTSTEFTITANYNGIFSNSAGIGETTFVANRRVALTYKQNYAKAMVNGTIVNNNASNGLNTSTDTGLPVVTSMTIGSGDERIITARARYYTKCLSDAALVNLTSL